MMTNRLVSSICLLLALFMPVNLLHAQDSSPDEVIVEMKSGDVIHGALKSESDDSIVVSSPVLGSLTLKRADIDSIEHVKGKDEESSKDSGDEKNKEVAVDVVEKSPWSGSVNLGLTYSDATTRSASFNVSARATKETDFELLKLNASYFYSQSSGVVSSNDVLLSADQTWYIYSGKVRSRWNAFAIVTYQWDEFQLWEQRTSPYAGLGYALVSEEDLHVGLRFGAGGTWEQANNEFDPQFLFEASTSWTVNDLQSVEGMARIAPNMSDFSNYILTLSGNWKVKLAKDSPFSLNLSVLNIYDSKPIDDGTNNDLKVVLSLGYDF